ncbi:hypothetical protein AYO40_03665 [Planctomycetaceae bacterium SCGC AG-212-D15]|nr:hypothetical protein AYO40_03665 [Planctomycetaceae bacterium SCGC AG-212-D15]
MGKILERRTGKTEPSGFVAETARMRLLLEKQLENNQLREARETAVALLCLNPNDPEALQAREFIEGQLAKATTHPVGEIRRLEGHQAAVNAVAISPDGKLALSGGGIPPGAGVFRPRMDYALRLWELETGKELHQYAGHRSMVTCVAFSPDGTRALSSAQDGGVFVWDVKSTQVAATVGRKLPHVFAAAFSPDGKRIFTASSDKLVRVWDIATGERVTRFQGHGREVTALALSPDGKHLLTGCLDGEVWLWDVATGLMARRVGGHTKCVYCVAFSPDGKLALSGGADMTARVWNISDGVEVRSLIGHTYAVCGVAFAPDGKTMLTGGDHTVRLWDAADGKEIRCFKGHTDSVRSIAYTPNSQCAVSASRDGTVRYWQLPGEQVCPVPSGTVAGAEDASRLSVPDWVTHLRRCRLLNSEWERELVDNLASRITNSTELFRHLVERGWLTDYQVNMLVEEHGLNMRLGDYVILNPLGAGGVGQVYKARRWGTNDQVALKIIQPRQDTEPTALKQFTSEIQALARMNHPNIIRTFEAGLDEGRHYFTMEYVDGTDLGALVEKYGPLPIERACKYIRQAAFGLEHAHEHCLIHRDIKPANLLLTVPVATQARPGLTGNWVAETALVKILDWGLAGLRRPAHIKMHDESFENEDLGTVDYVSPEQALDMHKADIRSDIYSLGCTLYQLLTGKSPFHGLTAVEKIRKHQTDYPAPVRSVRADAPEALDAVILKMIAKKPDDRYRTPALVVGALAPFCRK